MSDNTPITGELRDSMSSFSTFDGDAVVSMEKGKFGRFCDAIDAIHANLERENESLRRELDRMVGEQDEGPKDADGKPVRIGDVLEWPDGSDEPFEVVGIGLNGTVYYMYDESCEWTNASTKRHHAPTVEDVLTEFSKRVLNSGHQWGLDSAEVIAEYAAKLRLAGE